MNTDMISQILVGGLLGILGQGIRIIVGMKKLHTDNTAKKIAGDATEGFSASRLMLSIFIGFVAGAIASLVKGDAPSNSDKTTFIFTIMAAGYSGADFIEGVFNTYIKKLNPPTDK
jgi:uncharacterized membrane protein YeaQ/YmgE (transglycosylase-associated protein family)